MLGGLRSAMRNLRASDQAVNRGLDRVLDRAFRELDESGTRTASQAGFTW